MVRKALFATLAAVLVSGLAGCDLYFDGHHDTGEPPPSSDGYCDATGCYECYDDGVCYPIGDNGGTEPGGICYNNAECDPGCYCNADGACEEAGFCAGDADCPDGYTCDDRSSCVPDDTADGCEANTDCPSGSYCDVMTGACVGSWTCNGDDQCGPGAECDNRGTCVPLPCTTDDECLEGCYCDEATGTCVESGTCAPDGSCEGDLECNPDRNTCEVPDEPPPPPPVSCNGEITCDVMKPVCADGSTPAIADGCYTGECIVISECDVPPPPLSCEEIDDEDTCLARMDCKALYAGYDCTTQDGSACEDGDSGCTCERFEFAACQDEVISTE